MAIRRITKFLVILSFFLTIIITGCEEFGGGKQKKPNKIVYPKCESGNCKSDLCINGVCYPTGCYTFIGMDVKQGCEPINNTCSACWINSKSVSIKATSAVATYYTITYNGNGNTGGDVPTDLLQYTQGQNITILGNPQNLVKTGYSFVGWNTMADGSGTTYTQGQLFAMTFSANVILFAKWTNVPTYTITYNGNGNTGGSVPVDTTNYVQGQNVTILRNTQNLTKSGFTFNNWNTASDGSGITYTAGQILTIVTDNIILFAKWISAGWTQLSQSGTLPAARSGSTAIYDGNGNMVIFGGGNSVELLNELWSYNFSSNTWSHLSPSGSLPAGRSSHTAIYDGNGNMIIFGGIGNGTGYLNDLWKYNFSSNTWTHLSPSGSLPAGRVYHTAIYDGNGNMVIYGGYAYGTYFDDLWSYNFSSNTWTQLSQSWNLPTARIGHTAIYDGNGNMVIYGGGGKGTGSLNELWSYNFSSNTWSHLLPSGTLPAARAGNTAIYDGNGNMVIFGGGVISVGLLNELWKYNFSSYSWTHLLPSGTLPAARSGNTAIYDGNGNMIIYSGYGYDGNFNDIWKYKFNSD